MEEYPLIECRNCINREGCELITEIEQFLEKNTFLDISSSACDEYITEHVVDDNWTAYTGNYVEDAEEEDFDEDDLPSVEEMYSLLDAGIAEMKSKGLIPLTVEMSYDTMQLFLEDSVKGSTIKSLSSREHGAISVNRNESIGYAMFAISVYLPEDEDDDEYEDDEDA